MPERLPPEVIRRDLLPELNLTDADAQALAATYAALVSAVAAFPYAELRQVEPPLRSVPPEPTSTSRSTFESKVKPSA
jgi:hypothetical protein